MKKTILLFATLFVALTAYGQDCPRYANLMKKAKALWANGDFEKALNQLTAAREHCPAKATDVDRQFVLFTNEIARKYQEAHEERKNAEKREWEAKVAQSRSDSLFIESEKQKNNVIRASELARIMQDSAAKAMELNRLANDNVTLMIQLNDLEELGNHELKNKNYKKAIDYFEKAICELEKLETQDSFLIWKGAKFNAKRLDASQYLDVQKTFASYIKSGDSLLAISNNQLSIAYRTYLQAVHLDFEKDTLFSRLSKMEDYITDHYKSVKQLTRTEYQDLMVASADANKLLGDKVIALERIRNAVKYRPNNLSFIKDPEFNRYGKRQINKFLSHRFSLYTSIRGDFGSADPTLIEIQKADNIVFESSSKFKPNWNPIPIGFIFRLSPRFFLDFNLTSRSTHRNYYINNGDPQKVSSYILWVGEDQPGRRIKDGASLRTSLSCIYTVFRYNPNKNKSKSPTFQVQSKLGVQFSSLSQRIDLSIFRPSVVDLTVPDNGVVNDVSVSQYFGFRRVSEISYNILSNGSVIQINDFSEKNPLAIGFDLGIRLNIVPFGHFPALSIFSEINRDVHDTPFYSRVEEYPIGSAALYAIESTYRRTIEADEVEKFLEFWDYSLSSSDLIFSYRWAFNAGVIYNF